VSDPFVIFHAKGWRFHRLVDGAVQIEVVDRDSEHRVAVTSLRSEEWVALVAHVSAAGENEASTALVRAVHVGNGET